MARKITRQRLNKLLERYATTEQVLDVGAGGSSYGRLFPNRTTLDIDPERKPDIVADAAHMPFKDGAFRFVVCTEMLEHVNDPFAVERELCRVTAPGGMLVLTTRFAYPLHDVPADYWRFTKYGLAKLFHSWDIQELQEETRAFSAIAALLQRISFQTNLRGGKFTKGILAILTKIFLLGDSLIVDEFGDIKRKTRENGILSTGYLLVCKKK